MGETIFSLSWIIATVVVILPVCLTAAPLPPNGAFPNPGFPKYIQSGWAEITNPSDEGHVSIIYNAQSVDQILRNDGNVITKMLNITSYECLDSNTYRYIANQAIYPEETISTICVIEYANATHRLSAVMPAGEQAGCPESPFPTGLEDPNSNQTHSLYLRQDGVIPMPTETQCINQPNPYIPPFTSIAIRNKTESDSSIADMPYPRTYGAPISQGVWKGENIIALENRRFYAGARVIPNKLNTTLPGNLYAFVGQYLSHDCLSPTEYVSTSMVTRVFNNGAMDYMSACQNGTRIQGQNKIDTVNIEYGQGPNCTIYSIPEPSDVLTTEKFSFVFVEPLSSNPSTECAYQMELKPPAAATTESSGVAVFAVHKVEIVRMAIMVVASFAVVMLWF